jgi:hypothetical protein
MRKVSRILGRLVDAAVIARRSARRCATRDRRLEVCTHVLSETYLSASLTGAAFLQM